MVTSFEFSFAEKLFVDEVTPTCEKCNSVVKPDIVFFGENLPKKFYENVTPDFMDCNLVTLNSHN